MNKNDKIILTVGVVILILASVGIYFWNPQQILAGDAQLENLSSMYGLLSNDQPVAISVSDSNPFYAFIATPLAVNYDSQGNQHVKPLLVVNNDDPSTAVIRLYDQFNIQSSAIQIPAKNDISVKNCSLFIAQKYWNNSKCVLIIKNDQIGYSLGVAAIPLASYLSMPVIVADKMDQDIRNVLKDLGVKYSLVCGDIDGYGNSIRFLTVDEIMNTCIDIVTEKFEEINYITLTNPRDAWPPEILNTTVVLTVNENLKGGNCFPSHLIDYLRYGSGQTYSFTIPSNYKYALVKLDLRNLEDPRYVRDFGDDLIVTGSFGHYIRTGGSPAQRDSQGNIIEDQLHYESVYYDYGGEELDVSLSSVYSILDSAPFELKVTVEELSNPYYSMMPQLSSLAPYLTAYHKGIIYADSKFAFVADDDKLLNGKTLPGNTQVFDNPLLIPLINQHVYQNIHIPLNELIAKLTGVDVETAVFEENLKKACDRNPFYIALVGDAMMLPQYYYRSAYSDPYSNPSHGLYGTNCPSDFIYGNIDPEMYSLLPLTVDHLENDKYSDLPEVENIVGRLVGFDVQDVSALIARTIFYSDVIDDLEEWKNNAAILTGAGTDMQKLPVFTAIRSMLGITEPIKFPSGEKYFLVKRITNTFEQGGFNAQSAERGAAQRVGYSLESLREIKKDGLANRIFFPYQEAKLKQGLENWASLFDADYWLNALGDSSKLVIGGQLEENSNLIISDSHAIFFQKVFADVLLESIGKPRIMYQLLARYTPIIAGFRTPLGNVGQYSVREITGVEMGPSVMLVEGCGSGKIDGFLPTNSLACAYLHAGVNAYISPTTFSAFYGALEPRFGNRGVGFGVIGFLKAWSDLKREIYVPVYFNQYIFEHMNKEMFQENCDIGTALKNAKNAFLPAQLDIEFRWTPPLSIIDNIPFTLQQQIDEDIKSTAEEDPTFPVEKYCTIYQINLLGDPAFNPYEPCNEGR